MDDETSLSSQLQIQSGHFDANHLIFSKLCGPLSEHNVRYRSTASKSELVGLFQVVLISRWDKSPEPGRFE
ncbi:MAG: hypothetical protein Q9175_001223 [Cornicularia normoerica]